MCVGGKKKNLLNVVANSVNPGTKEAGLWVQVLSITVGLRKLPFETETRDLLGLEIIDDCELP